MDLLKANRDRRVPRKRWPSGDRLSGLTGGEDTGGDEPHFDFHQGVIPFSPKADLGPSEGSGIGRETHKMMLDHYQQTKNMLVNYSPNKLGFL